MEISRIVTLGHRGGHDLAYSIALALAVRDVRYGSVHQSEAPAHAELIWLRTGRTLLLAKPGRIKGTRLNDCKFTDWKQKIRKRLPNLGDLETDAEQPVLETLRRGSTVNLESLSASVRGVVLLTGLSTYLLRRLQYLIRTLWWSLRAGADEFQQKILKSTVSGIHVGDLVASTALTTQHRLSRGIRSAMNLSACFTQAAAIIDAARRVNQMTDVHLAISPESTYLPMVLPRTLGALGLPALLETRTEALFVGSADLEASVRTEIRVRHQRLVVAQDESPCIGECHHLEVVRKRLVLLRSRDDANAPYALSSAVGNADSVAMVFLHDFGDGQFFYGFDEFGDLFAWVCCVVDTLLEETDCTVILKSHSIVKPLYRTLNEKALLALKHRYTRESRVRLVTVPVSAMLIENQLAGVAWFGITKHGTVSEEMPVLGRACLASRLGPWGNEHDFAWRYSTKGELRELIRVAPSLGLRPEWRSELCVYLQRRYGSNMDASFRTRGTHEVSRLVVDKLGRASGDLDTMNEWALAADHLNTAGPSDDITLQVIREVAASSAELLHPILIGR